MNKILRNYAILNTNWIPLNPSQTIMPFFIHLIKTYQIQNASTQEISQHFFDMYGFNIPYSILNNILNFLYNNSMLTNNKEKYHFDLDSINKHHFKDLTKTDDYNTKIGILHNRFCSFCEVASIPYGIFEKTLFKFLKSYDDLGLDNNDFLDIQYTEDNSDDEIYLFMFVEFVKKLYEENDVLFELVINICQGSIILGFISDDVYSDTTWKDKNIYLDTPIILRALGYTDEYYFYEYSFLLKKWKEFGAKLKIFDHTFEEISSLLRSCEHWIDSKEYNISKASSLSNYFKYTNKTKHDVSEALAFLKKNISDLSIEIVDTTQYSGDEFFALCAEFEEEIKVIYDESRKYYFYKENDRSIDYDSKSLALIKIKNKYKKVQEYAYLDDFFITTNSSLVKCFKSYFLDSISPVMKDTIIGVSICSINIDDCNNLSKMKLLSYCYNAYQPTNENKTKYIDFLNKAKEKGEITEEKYCLLKNHYLVPEEITKITFGNNIELQEDCIDKIMKNIEYSIVQDERKRLFKDDYNSFIKKVKVYNIILCFLCVVILLFANYVTYVVSPNVKGFIFLCSIIGTLYTSYSIIMNFIPKKTNFLINIIIKRKIKKLCNKYSINEVDIFANGLNKIV
jgi:hypothetical protein